MFFVFSTRYTDLPPFHALHLSHRFSLPVILSLHYAMYRSSVNWSHFSTGIIIPMPQCEIARFFRKVNDSKSIEERTDLILGSSGTSACDRREDLEGSQHLLNQILDAALFSDFLEPLRT
ncbi:unnamed protein product [Schistocephalus solidus]|uniref:Uncharacterized protein n=1 Tax=Schistocephalus solidus TaxID=70667 RepID=A0A183SWM9_SCHSO|nr:unnamed protein product [Schistocephalus solidus]